MNFLRNYCSPQKKNVLVERGLDLRLRAKRSKYYLKWGCINVVLLAVLLFDISNKCPYAHSKWYVLEYVAVGILGISVLACFVRYFLYIFRMEPVEGNTYQKNLLQFDDNDNSFVIAAPVCKNTETKLCTAPPINASMLSWHSSFNDSRGPLSPNFSRSTTPPRQSLSPQQNQSKNDSWDSSTAKKTASFNTSNASYNTPFVSPYTQYSEKDMISDEKTLKIFLKEAANREKEKYETADSFHTLNSSSIKSFWNYCNSAANLLKTSVYQLAPIETPATPNKQSGVNDGGLNILDRNSEVIKRISLEKLAQYVGNLRRWIAFTILHRLTKEIEHIDESFKNRGFLDMQIGNIGLERLKKIGTNQQFVGQFMPRLPSILPFLEMSNNQEYLVQRIKDLAKGSCISDYCWNSGTPYHGVNWDEHLPTDSAIIFHLFCVYLDSQLLPLPQGGGRPFYNRYVVMGDEKRSIKDTIAVVQNRAHCAILCTNLMNPKFNFISEKQIHTCAYGRNNLFYVIIQFLIYMRTHHESSLEGVNLGKSGINIMCVIED